jgi:hypothetical protein
LKNKTVTASPIVGGFLTWVVAKPKMRSLGVAAQTLYNMLCEIGEEKIAEGTWQSPDSRSGRQTPRRERILSGRQATRLWWGCRCRHDKRSRQLGDIDFCLLTWPQPLAGRTI